MEFKQVVGNTWCFDAGMLIPVYRTDNSHCIMMDTGAQYMRRDIEAALEAQGLTPIGLLCTHTHFDHFGNANYFSHKYRCPVALPLGEAEICRTVESVKSHLFAYPEGQVRSDPKMAEIACMVDHVIRPEERDTLFRGVRFRVIHTPGHGLDHVSYITPDNVCYAGDALMCGKSLTHSKLPYTFHFGRSLESIRRLRDIDCEAMILAHRGVVYDGFETLADENRTVMENSLETLRKMVDRPMSSGEICREVCHQLNVRVDTTEKAQNLERFLRPYMEWMVDTGSHRLAVRDCILCYEPVK